MSAFITKIDPRLVNNTKHKDGGPARGCRPLSDAKMLGELPVYEDVFGSRMRDYPRSDWDDFLKDNVSLEILVRWLHDQLQEGACASNALMGCWETCMSMTMGPLHSIMLSPIGVYRWVATGPNSGSNIADNIVQMQKVGSLPVDTPENRARLKKMGLNESHVLKHTGYYQQFPAGWEETAAHFRIVEAYRATTFEGCVSGLFDDFVLFYGRAAHAIFGVTVVKSEGVYHLKYGNSWGEWGERGENGLVMFGYDSESFVRNAIASYGAFLVRSVLLTDAFMAGIAA